MLQAAIENSVMPRLLFASEPPLVFAIVSQRLVRSLFMKSKTLAKVRSNIWDEADVAPFSSYFVLDVPPGIFG